MNGPSPGFRERPTVTRTTVVPLRATMVYPLAFALDSSRNRHATLCAPTRAAGTRVRQVVQIPSHCVHTHSVTFGHRCG